MSGRRDELPGDGDGPPEANPRAEDVVRSAGERRRGAARGTTASGSHGGLRGDLLTRLPAEDRGRLAAHCLEIRAGYGETIASAAEPPGARFLIVEGRARVLSRGDDGEEITLARLGPGDVVGDELRAVRGRRETTVRASDDVVALRLGAPEGARLLSEAPHLEGLFAPVTGGRALLLPMQRAESGEDTVTGVTGLPFAALPVAVPPALDSARSGVPEPILAPTAEHPFASAGGHFRTRRAPRRFSMVYQVDEMDCGTACLAMVCRHFGRRVSQAKIRALTHTGADGTSLSAICRAATELGLAARSARVSSRNVDRMPVPAILHWDRNHWVVLVEVRARKARIADPASGDRWISREELARRFSGSAALFDYTDAFAAAPVGRPRVSWLLAFLRPHAGTLVRALLLAVLATVLSLLVPVLTQFVVDRVVVDGATAALTRVLAGMGATLLTLTLASLLQGYLLSFVAVRVDAAALDFLTRKLLALPMDFFFTRRTGDIQLRLDGVHQLREMLVTSGIQGALAVLQAIVALLIMTVYSRTLTLVFIATTPLYLGLMVVAQRLLRPVFGRLEEVHGLYRSDQMDAIKGIEAVKAAGAEASFRDALLERFLGAAGQQFRADFAVQSYRAALQAVGFLTSVLFLFFGARLAMRGEITIGGLVAFESLVATITGPLATFLGLWDRVQLGRVLVDRLSDVFERDPEQGSDRAHLLPVRSLAGAVELRDVGFRYGGPETPMILRNVNLRAEPGKTIAIVGRSGAGKTTLVKLLAGLLEPTSGRILFDSVDQKLLNWRDLRRHLGFVLQENHMFSGTILENIAFGEEPDLDRATSAARAANAHEFIERLPFGYDTKIGESGLALSAGQRQRIAIARAIYRKPAVLIFDEATSALDTESERAIQDNMRPLLAGRTAFVIAHRLSTVREADEIIVLERGEIAERGTHGELMGRGGIYAQLVSRQVEG